MTPRFFNTAGPCDPDDHYMLPPEARLPGVRSLIDRKSYFVIHAPRQVGKTTCCLALAHDLTESGSYTALVASCETGQAAGGDVERGIAAVLEDIHESARSALPAALRPPSADPTVPAEGRLRNLLGYWAAATSRPIVLFLDEIDALVDEVLIAVLRQLRSGYARRPGRFPQSVALIGLRDVRDYRREVRPDQQTLGTAPPFNVKVESLTVRNFTAPEIVELYEQHTQETGQEFTAEAKALAFELTGGQPWLVNALARQAVDVLAVDRATPITPAILDAGNEILIQRRDTHLDSLIERLREPRVRRIIEPLMAGDLIAPDVLHDDIQFSLDLGLVVDTRAGLAQVARSCTGKVVSRPAPSQSPR